jgi:hypothetical protein
MYGENLELLYIGKASMNRCLGNRLYEYFGSGTACTPKAEWLQQARYVVNICYLSRVTVTLKRPRVRLNGSLVPVAFS